MLDAQMSSSQEYIYIYNLVLLIVDSILQNEGEGGEPFVSLSIKNNI